MEFWSILKSIYVAFLIHFARLRVFYVTGVLVILFFGLFLGFVFFVPASNFPSSTRILIPYGSSLGGTATLLAEQHVIRFPFIFKVVLRLAGGDHGVKAGDYVFKAPVGLARVTYRIEQGITGIAATRVTFVEGATSYNMDTQLSSALPDFDVASFDALAQTQEGYLFPDTYFFPPDTSPTEVIALMKANFANHIGTIQSQIDAFGKPLNDDVIMASILEREANTPEDRHIVSGILWNRIQLGIPLQVDAVFGYIHRENGYTPTSTDLSSDSPYNTYRNKGLPPNPISNPGLDALLASVTPAKTDYLYYLTGKDGKMHYAKTFAEHKKNISLYL